MSPVMILSLIHICGLYERNRYRRRPGTVAVAAAIHNKYDITVVPHILCSGFSREDTEYILLDLQFLGITNLLVLRGDKAKDESSFVPEKNGYAHALESVSYTHLLCAYGFVLLTAILLFINKQNKNT